MNLERHNNNGLPRWCSGKEFTCQCRRHKRHGVDPPEQEMATQASILAWEIPWTEQPRELQSLGLQRYKFIYVYELRTSQKIIVITILKDKTVTYQELVTECYHKCPG